MFGPTNNANFGGFGKPNTSTGTTSLFGNNNAASSGFGGFGAKPGGLFGNAPTPAATTAFGVPAGGSLFGSGTQNTGGLFGGATTVAQQPTGGGGLFGSSAGSSFLNKPTAPATSFGTASGTMFGTTTGFGTVVAGAPVTGTTNTKYTATDGTDNMVKNGISITVKTKHYCITGMKQYEAKSLEELRLDDYAAGVKGPKAAGTTAATSLFGATQPAAASTGFGGFGSVAATSAAAPFSGFGAAAAPASTAFALNKPTGGLFGAPATSTGGLFGQPATSSTGFGATANTGGLFGNPAAAKPNPFGTTTGFGQTGTAFGQASTASTGFGGFGAKPTTGFGAPASTSTGFGGFGTQNTASTGFGFGAKPVTAFGAQPVAASTGFGFGAVGQNTATTGFGLNKPTTGFGTSTLGFGTGGTAFSGLGATAQQQQQLPVQLASNIDLETQQNMIKQQIFTLANSPYGDSPLFRNTLRDSKAKKDLMPTDPATQKTLLTSSGSKLKINARPTVKVKLTNLSSVQAIGTSTSHKGDLFEGLDDDCIYTPEKHGARRSVKKLVIRSSPALGGTSSRLTTADQHQSAFSSPSLYSSGPVGRAPADLAQSPLAEETFNLSRVDKPIRHPVNRLYPDLDNTMDQFQSGSASARPSKPSPADRKPPIDVTYTSDANPSPTTSPDMNRGTVVTPPTMSLSTSEVKGRLSISKQEHVDIVAAELAQDDPAPHPCGVVSTRADYYTLPALDELENYMDANGECLVDNLSIGREGYGSVFFPGTTNVTNLDIDSNVHFRRKEITVYPDDDIKPAEGQGLNKRAEVTLDCVWPNDKSTHSPIKSPERLSVMNYQEKIELATSRIGAKFVDYRPDTGSWVFEVKHFSKYGLLDDDSDEDNQSQQDVKKLKALHQTTSNVQKQPIEKLASTTQQRKLASGDSPLSKPADTLRGTTSAPISTVGGLNYLDMDDSDEERENQRPLVDSRLMTPLSKYSQAVDERLSTSYQLAVHCGAEPTNVQRMKASFLDDDEEEDDMSIYRRRHVQRDLDGSMSAPMLKHQVASTFSPLPHSPLIRSSIKAASPTPDRLGASRYKTESMPEMKREFEPDIKTVGSLLKPHRVSSEIRLPEPDYTVLPSGATRPLKPRSRIQGHRLQLTQIPLEKSLLKDGQKNVIDSGCTAGRRSHVGWAPNMILAHNGNRSVYATEEKRNTRLESHFSILSPGRSRLTSPYQVTLETANVGAQSYQTDPLVLETRMKALRIQLRNSVRTQQDVTSCDRLEPAPGIAALHEYGKESLNDLDAAVAGQSDGGIQTMFRQHILVWELAVALWGSLPEFEHIDDLDNDSYLYQNARNEAFSRWLSYAANYSVEKETSQKYKKARGIPAAIFSHLTAHQIPEATRLALESKDLRLALLLSQASSSQTTKNMIHKQLTDWNKTMADKFISADRLKLYVILAGNLIWENSSGLINCCTDLDWKRALALHYWYSQSKLNIPSAVARYDAAWRDDSDCERYAAPPLPLYMEESGDDDSRSRDTCYHLLKLYCNSGYRLDHLLSSASSTSDPLDYHTSWHLLQLLLALGYTHLGEWQTEALHMRYAEQLESCGLWEWATLPLLNLLSPHARAKSIKDLLLRHVRLNVIDNGSCEESDSIMSNSDEVEHNDSDYLKKEKFLLTEVNIPSQWLHEAKAVKAKCEGLHEEEAWHLLLSQQLNSAHQIILEKIAPQLIVQDDLDELHSYLDLLQQGCESVSEWRTGGKIYLDYITTQDVIDEMRQQESEVTDGYSLERLKPEVNSLGRRLLSLSTPTPLHLLAQANMALHTAQSIKYMMSLDSERLIHDTDVVTSRCLVEPLSQLPLQSDDAVSLLRETLSAFMLEY